MVETIPEDDILYLTPMSSQPDTTEFAPPLRQLLEAAMCRSLNLDGNDPKEFIPEPDLYRILTPDSALEALISNPGIADLVCRIYAPTIFNKQKPYIKTFAILVLIDRIDALPAFMQNSLGDKHLPLTFTSTSGEMTTLVRSLEAPSCSDLSLMGFSHYEALLFVDTQWKLLAPVFTRRQLDNEPLEFSEETILPFIMSESSPGLGMPQNEMSNNSRIYKVQIHDGHHDFPTAEVAVKKLLHGRSDDYKRELEALKTLGRLGQPHITKLLATFECGKKFYFLFPWAESDLHSFFANQSPSSPRKLNGAVVPTTTWTAKQMLGIAGALKAIHYCQQNKRSEPTREKNSYAAGWSRHGDIKPQNILCFKSRDSDTLKLCDFGSSRIGNVATPPPGDRPADFSPTYRAPEHDVGIFDGQKTDIWSLGCVMSVAATWMTLGSKGVKTFDADRRTKADGRFDNSFFEVFKDQEKGTRVRLKAAVSQLISRLHRAPTASLFTHDLLNLVQDGMLEVDGSKRMSIGDIVSSLEKMFEMCSSDPGYTKAAPWRHSPSWTVRQRLLTGALSPQARSLTTKLASVPSTMRQGRGLSTTTPRARSLAVNVVKVPSPPRRSRMLPTITSQAPFGSNYTNPTHGLFPEIDAKLSVTLPSSLPGQFFSNQAHHDSFMNQSNPVFEEMGFYTAPDIGGLACLDTEQYLASFEEPPIPHFAVPESTSGEKRRCEPDNNNNNKAEVKRRRSQKQRTKVASSLSGPEEPIGLSSKVSTGAQDEERPLACPYYKHDPKKYCKKNWKLCGSDGWDDIHRLKEHLSRKHHKSGHKCSICLERLPSTDDLKKHYNAHARCVKRKDKVDDMMDDAQWGLCQAQWRGKTRAYKWCELYKIIFGSTSPENMPSPYRDDLEMFRKFLESKKQQSACDKFQIDMCLKLVREFQNPGSLGSVTESTDASELPSLTGGWSNDSTSSVGAMAMSGEAEVVQFEYDRTPGAKYQSQQAVTIGQDALADGSQFFLEEFRDLSDLDQNGSVI